jgi:DNA processing protein
VNEPAACPECLPRPWLLAELAPFIENLVSLERGSRVAELLALDEGDLLEAAAPKHGGRVTAHLGDLGEAGMRRCLEEAGCWAVCPHDPIFPAALGELGDPPVTLVGRGDPGLLAAAAPERTVTIVGARRASAYGRLVAADLGRSLSAAGLLVVSGLAYGIDGAAHRGALEAGPTVAVLGCGPDVAYPAAHRGLHRRIGESGLVLSEIAPGQRPWRWMFPARNRIMAGLAGMTVVVEARERSGSLITATFAQQLGRDVGAVPGPVTSPSSDGPNALLAAGACLVRDGQDVLDAMLGAGAGEVARSGPPLEPDLAAALDAFERCDGSCASLAGELGVDLGAASVALAHLELLGYVEGSSLGRFTRTPLKPPAAPDS